MSGLPWHLIQLLDDCMAGWRMDQVPRQGSAEFLRPQATRCKHNGNITDANLMIVMERILVTYISSIIKLNIKYITILF